MKKHKDFLLTLLGIAVLAGLIFAVRQSKRPAPLVIDLSDQVAPSPEHRLVEQALVDIEGFAAVEESKLDALLSAPKIVGGDQPLPVAGQPLPAAWESQPAPTIDEVELSPALRRSLAASADLRTDRFVDPSSEFNLQRVAELRAIREQRQNQH